jgi:hypothetical protein
MASVLQKVVGGGAVKAEKPLKLYSHAGVSDAFIDRLAIPLTVAAGTEPMEGRHYS